MTGYLDKKCQLLENNMRLNNNIQITVRLIN